MLSNSVYRWVTLLVGMSAMLSTAVSRSDDGPHVYFFYPVINIKAVYGGRCLDLQGDNRTNRTPVQIYDCNGTPAQRWSTMLGATGSLMVGDNTSNKVLDAPYTTDYSTTWIFDWWGGDNQKWSMPRIEILAKVGNKCITVGGAQDASTSTAILASCNGSSNQKWFYDFTSGRIRANDGRCLGIADGISTDYIPFANVRPCINTANQQWALVGSQLRLQWDFKRERCMGQWSWMTADTLLPLVPCSGDDVQKFYARGSIVGLQSGKCLRLPRDSSGAIKYGSGVLPELYSCADDVTQKWTFHW